MEFRIGTNELTQKPMVEALEDGQFIAGIYGHDDGIRIVSKYIDGVEHEPVYPPSIVIKLSK